MRHGAESARLIPTSTDGDDDCAPSTSAAATNAPADDKFAVRRDVYCATQSARQNGEATHFFAEQRPPSPLKPLNYGIRRRRKRHSEYGGDGGVFPQKSRTTVILAAIIFSLILGLFLTGVVFLRPLGPADDDFVVDEEIYERFRRRPELRFGAARAEDVELWLVDGVDSAATRRRRSAATNLRAIGERNLASECGAACTLRLRHPLAAGGSQRDVAVSFRRWAGGAPPLVQLLDADANRSTLARPFSAPAACIYAASVNVDVAGGAKVPHSIVNLCGDNGGMFGMLTFADAGTFAIEPLLEADDESGDRRASRRRRTAPIDAVAEARLRTAHLVYRLLPQRYDATVDATVDGSPTTLSKTLNDLKDRNDLNPSSASSRSTAERSSDDDLNDLSNDFEYKTSSPSSPSSLPPEHQEPHAKAEAGRKPRIVILHENSTVDGDESADGNRWRRPRRAANSWDNYIEVLVVADYRMLLYHQRHLENYVLTLFSTVASIYRHPSLGASINIVVVRLIILKHERAGPQVSQRAQQTLQQFCAWQQNYNDPNDDALSHHDVAILLTRHDICRATNKCDTLGLAELGTMCDAQKSCAIIEDNGLSAAFTIAHELGHTLNIPHDDERKCGEFMPLNKNNYHIMAPTLEYNTNPWSWSPCSAHMLSKFLDTHRAQTHCILDQPAERRYFDRMFENSAPGSVYSVNQQCQFVFGAGAEICPYMPTCRRLWCSVSYGYQMGCRTQHMPWADGTSCGDNMWCHSGHCVGMSPRQRQKQDGSWGDWSTWRECSRSCGGGVQKALRDCDSPPPANGGRYCIGQRERYRSCNVHDCPWDTAGFRESQCASFDGRDVGIHGVPPDAKWLPKYTGVSENERCQLYCRQVGSAAFYLLRDKVMDGTPCDQSTDDICIDGVCHTAGCDHRLGSERQRDTCGICGGNGTTCRTVHGTFNERTAFGYNEVLRLPAGAANIDIRQTAYNNANDDDNYLALRSSNGDFLLNGHYQVSVFRQQVYVLDTVLEYSGSDHATERLNGTGPLRADVFLHVLSVGQLNPPNIQYTFTVPIEQRQQLEEQRRKEHQEQQQQQQQQSLSSPKSHHRHSNHHHNPHPQPPPVNNFYWRHADSWSNCTAKCQGSQTRRIVCVESAAHAPGQQRVVEDRMCTSASAPDPQQRACNVDCFNKWTTTSRQIACLRVFTNGGEELAPEEECRAAGLTRPPPTPTPNDNGGGRYQGRWTYSEYSTCSTSCGTSGVAQRHARCVDAAGSELDARHCDASLREPIRTDCNRTPCPRWAYGHWSECSRSCGGGVRVRHAVCQDVGGGTLPAARCPAGERIDREKCNDTPCTQWEFGDWSTCTTTCGRGVQRREARCIELSLTSGGAVVDASRCDSRARIVEKECTLTECARWQAGTWSACSATCADGFQTRTVACVGAADARLAERACVAAGERPASHRTCHSGTCPQWRIREWSECSVTCGTGVRRRDVACMFREQAVDDSLCATATGGAAVAPIRQEHCALLACTRWDVQPWGGCSATCGTGGVQRRVVRCLRGATVADDRDCDTATQPRPERACERDPCPMAEYSWETGAWSECSASCGGGTQQRAVQCIARDGRRLTDEYCRRLATARPQTSQTCNAQICVAQWRVGPWAPNCPPPADCRRPAVVQRRRVFCESMDDGAARRRRRTLPDAHCDAGMRPMESRDCEIPPACHIGSDPTSTTAVWDVGNWTMCSASCGGGWRRRAVDCIDGVSKAPRPASLCVSDQRPAEFEPCNADACATVAWQTDEWSTCSVTCGAGVQRRRVWCRSEVLTALVEVDAALCARQTNTSRLTETRACRAPADCVAWRPGQWSACSQSCGRGVRKRTVKCVALDDDGEDKNEVDAALCADMPRPTDEHKCRDVQCPRWQTSAWMPCSASCGAGVSRRDVFCQRGRHARVDDSECAHAAKPFETRACQTTACPTYRWNVVSPWSKCTELCKPSDQHRRVQCVSDANRRAADAMCEANGEPAPITRLPCPLTACPYHWVAGAWSTCSKTCGSGIQFRKIECHISTSLIALKETSKIKKRSIPSGEISSGDSDDVSSVTEAATLPPAPATSSMVVASRFCVSLERPAVSASCQLSNCDAPFQWNVGPWSECSSTCGPGFRRRRVRCLSRINGERVDRKHCEGDGVNGTIASPRRRESCFLRNCLSIDCADVKSQHNGLTILGDGDYDVVVNGRRVLVYCYAMNETVPKTYISVDNDTNFAEFYSKRLAYPYSCPYEGRRNDSCACNDDGHVNHGRTRFSRLRVDLRNMPNDFTFASSDYGNMVAYGSAGDCYSMTECPQGHFSIDLRGTGLKIADDLQWVGQGYRVTTRVERSEGGMRVDGVCGGYCGECAPDRFKGLVLEPFTEKSP